jgi:hypothetical protein
MTESSFATHLDLDIATVFQFDDRHATPNASHARVKIARMSLEWFVNRYLGYAPPFTLLITRHPSEWIKPRSSSSGCASVMLSCQGASSILRRCLGPELCCGNTHGQWDETWTQPGAGTTPTRAGLDGRTAPIDRAHSSMIRGYRTSSETRRRNVRLDSEMQPSPRYSPRRYAYGSGGTSASPPTGQSRSGRWWSADPAARVDVLACRRQSHTVRRGTPVSLAI